MLTIGCPQQVCASGNSTSTPSRRSSVTTACPTSGNSASLMQVTISATFTGPWRSFQARGTNRARPWVRATSARRSRRGRARPRRPRAPARARCRSPSPRPGRPAPAPARSAMAWQSRVFCTPPPTTCTTPTVAPASDRRGSSAVAIRGGDALDDQRTAATRAVGGGASRARRTTRAIRAGMSPGGRKRWSCTSTPGPVPAYARPPGSTRQVGLAPGPHRLAEQPGAHHVRQEADRPVDPALVGEVGEPASSVSTGSSSSRPASAQVPRET